MKYKTTGIIYLLVFSLAFCSPLMALEQRCPRKAQQGGCGGEKSGCGVEKKVLCKLRLAMINQDKLGLSDDQVAGIKQLQTSTEKDSIKREAEISIIDVDMKSKLWDGKMDKESINSLIEKKYELKKANAKALIDVYFELNNILTEEQKKKLKELGCQSSKCTRGQIRTPCAKQQAGNGR